jgi:hypothetical protein
MESAARPWSSAMPASGVAMEDYGSVSERMSAGVSVLAFVAVVWEYRNQARRTRLELAQTLSRELETDEILLFAVTCLDWTAGTIPIPERWRAVIGKPDYRPDLLLMERALNCQLLPDIINNPSGLLLRHAFVSLFNQIERVQGLYERQAVKMEDLSSFGWIAAQLTNWQYIACGKRRTFFLNAVTAWYGAKLARFIIALAKFHPEPARRQPHSCC